MSKALMAFYFNGGITSGAFIPAVEASGSLTESDVQYQATQAATLSSLAANITAGNSGTATLRVRKNTANGNLVASRSSTGTLSDTANTDVLASGDVFNFSNTLTGTDATYTYIRTNVDLTTPHGNFYGSGDPNTASVVYDVASSTRFLPIVGQTVADGAATEADVAFRSRAHTTWAALQLRVTANARTNSSTVKNRIAAADGTASIAIGSGLTGIFKQTGIGDAIADGNALCASLTLGTGVEDLVIAYTGATLTSSSKAECDAFSGVSAGATRAASATAHYVPIAGFFASPIGNTSETVRAMTVGFAGTARNLRCYIVANTYSGSCTVKLFKNGSAVITLTISAGATGWQENSANTVSFVDTDTLSIEVAGGTSGSITATLFGVTLSHEALGTTAKTLGALTSSGTGTVSISGTLSKTLGSLTSSATGTVLDTGALSKTLGTLTSTATGTVLVSGTLAQSLAAVTCSGTGTVLVSGTASLTLAALTSSAAGTVLVSGAASITLGALSLSAEGTSPQPGPEGTLSVTLGALTCSGIIFTWHVPDATTNIWSDAAAASGAWSDAAAASGSWTDQTAAGGVWTNMPASPGTWNDS